MKAIYVIHNYVRIKDGNNYEEIFFIAPLSSLTGSTTRRAIRVVDDIRAKLMDYFINEGSIEW